MVHRDVRKIRILLQGMTRRYNTMTTQLQLRRQGAGMSQSELARKAEISVRTLQSLETGARNIDKVAVLTALKLARALDCNIEDILDWSE